MLRARPFLPPAGEGGSRRSPARRMTEEGEPDRLQAVKSFAYSPGCGHFCIAVPSRSPSPVALAGDTLPRWGREWAADAPKTMKTSPQLRGRRDAAPYRAVRARPFLPPAGEGGIRRSPARRMTEEGEPDRLQAVKSFAYSPGCGHFCIAVPSRSPSPVALAGDTLPRWGREWAADAPQGLQRPGVAAGRGKPLPYGVWRLSARRSPLFCRLCGGCGLRWRRLFRLRRGRRSGGRLCPPGCGWPPRGWGGAARSPRRPRRA